MESSFLRKPPISVFVSREYHTPYTKMMRIFIKVLMHSNSYVLANKHHNPYKRILLSNFQIIQPHDYYLLHHMTNFYNQAV